MAVKKYKATTNGRRNMSVLTYDEITTSTPENHYLSHLLAQAVVIVKVKLP